MIILYYKAYFEVKLQSSGIWGIGIALGSSGLDRIPLGEDAYSWVLRHTGEVVHDKMVIHTLKSKVEEGDVLVSHGYSMS